MFMAINATEHGGAGGMAFHAIKSAVLAAVDRETVVEGTMAPIHRIVAISTGGWEAGRLVIRIGGALVIGKVASHARRTNAVVIKTCPEPSIGSVAVFASGWNAVRLVSWIIGGLVRV